MALQKDDFNLSIGAQGNDVFVDNWVSGKFTAGRTANLNKVFLVVDRLGNPGVAELVIRDVNIGDNKPEVSPVLDVNNPNVTAPTLAAANTSGGTGNRRFAYEFTPGITGFLKEVDIQLQKNGVTTGLSLTAEIFLADLNGFPTGSVLATETVVDGQIASSAPTTITFTTPAAVAASTTYVIVLRDDDNANTTDFYRSFGNSGSGRFATSDNLGVSYVTNVGDLYIVTRVSQVANPDLGVATVGVVPVGKSIVEFDFTSSPVPVTSGTRYAMILRSPSGDSSNRYKADRTSNTGETRPLEDHYSSSDGGQTWSLNTTRNISFVVEFDDAAPSPALDQFSFAGNLNSFSAVTDRQAQTFVPTESGTLEKVVIGLSSNDLSPSTNTVIEIQTTTGGGEPSGTVIGSGSISNAIPTVTTGVETHEVTLSSPANLTAGVKYAMVMVGSVDSMFIFRSVVNLYTGGNRLFSTDSGTSWTPDVDDLVLGTFMAVPTIQTITSDAFILLTPEQTITSDAQIGTVASQTILSDADVASEITQTITSDAFVGEETTQTILSDASIFATVTQTILSDTNVAIPITQTILSDTLIAGTTTQGIASNATILVSPEQTIFSEAIIIRNEPLLQLFASTAPTVEVGTLTNPLEFTGVIAGQEFQHPDNPFFLFNDKGGLNKSVDARDVNFRILAFELLDELQGNSSGAANQTFTVAFPPVFTNDIDYPLIVKVGGVIWTRLDSLAGAPSTDEVYTFNFSTGLLTFGDGITGKIPVVTLPITVTYTPDTTEFGSEISTLNWFGVQSNEVINNPVLVNLERQTSTDANTVITAHTPLVAVTGVFLNSDPNRLGTNFFTSGTFNAVTGEITLGTSLPSANEEVLIDYSYEIEDDAEGEFTDIGQETSHTFANPIPSNNAKKLNFRLTPPTTTSPSGIMDLRFRIRIAFKA